MANYWEEQIEKTKSLIAAMDQALLEFALDGAKQTASIDTGQSRVSYTRADISSLERVRYRLMVQLQTLEKAAGKGPGGLYLRPGF